MRREEHHGLLAANAEAGHGPAMTHHITIAANYQAAGGGAQTVLTYRFATPLTLFIRLGAMTASMIGKQGVAAPALCCSFTLYSSA
jgi:hypothetical protein